MTDRLPDEAANPTRGAATPVPNAAAKAHRAEANATAKTVGAGARKIAEAAGRRSRRSTFLKWLRQVHGWIGLWGAVLGLMFGATGFLLNHRGGPLKISTGQPQVSQMQMWLPDPVPGSPRALAEWVNRELAFGGRVGRTQREPAREVAWGDRGVMQPEHWSATLAGPKTSIAIDYWAGSKTVSVKRTEGTLLAMLSNMHKGVGMSIAWTLVVDTIAGSLILLSLTGVLLWTELNKRKTVGAAVFVASLIALIVCGVL